MPRGRRESLARRHRGLTQPGSEMREAPRRNKAVGDDGKARRSGRTGGEAGGARGQREQFHLGSGSLLRMSTHSRSGGLLRLEEEEEEEEDA